MFETYPKKSASPNGSLGEAKSGKDKFTPKKKGGHDGRPGHPSGKTNYPPQRPESGRRLQSKSKQVPVWADGGGNEQVSEFYPKSAHNHKSEKSVSRSTFVPCTSGKTAPNQR